MQVLIATMSSPDFSDAILMRYETPLPDDFDMEAIRIRIHEKARAFDQMPGMFVKFYAVNEVTAGPLNEYSSIYLWSKPGFLTGFFTGDFFENYANAFARPVAKWALVHQVNGDFRQLQRTKAAIRQTIGIPRKAQIGQFVKSWEERSRKSNALARVVAIDPAHWELIDFEFFAEQIAQPPGVNAHRYDIVHVSQPGAK
jgi:uncharacterized protein DUF4865